MNTIQQRASSAPPLCIAAIVVIRVIDDGDYSSVSRKEVSLHNPHPIPTMSLAMVNDTLK